MVERTDLSNRINVMLFHFDQRLGPRLLFNVAEVSDPRITSALTRLMDFNFLQEMKAFVNAMANVVYSSMFFSVPNPLARGGTEQFMISIVIFDPTITEYLMVSSLEEEMEQTTSKLMMLTELIIIANHSNPSLENFPELSSDLHDLKDKVIEVFQELFYGQFEGKKDAISQILGKIGNEAGKKIIQNHSTKNIKSSRAYLTEILKSPIISRWGKFTILHYDPEERVANISLKNSIWTDSLGLMATKACAFIEGMLESLFSHILGEPIICNEMRCAAEYSYVQECYFQIAPRRMNQEKVSYREEQTIRDMALEDRRKTIELIETDMGKTIFQDLDPMIRLIQLFNKAPFISDFYIDETKFLIVCNYWRYPDEIICNSCEKWIEEKCKEEIKLVKSPHRICEITYGFEKKSEKK